MTSPVTSAEVKKSSSSSQGGNFRLSEVNGLVFIDRNSFRYQTYTWLRGRVKEVFDRKNVYICWINKLFIPQVKCWKKSENGIFVFCPDHFFLEIWNGKKSLRILSMFALFSRCHLPILGYCKIQKQWKYCLSMVFGNPCTATFAYAIIYYQNSSLTWPHLKLTKNTGS